MRYMARSAVGLVALGAMSACHSPKPPYLTGVTAVTTPGARTDALWMIALPPVTVLAPADSAVATQRPTSSQRHRVSSSKFPGGKPR